MIRAKEKKREEPGKRDAEYQLGLKGQERHHWEGDMNKDLKWI